MNNSIKEEFELELSIIMSKAISDFEKKNNVIIDDVSACREKIHYGFARNVAELDIMNGFEKMNSIFKISIELE